MSRPNYTLRELEALRAVLSTGTTTAAARRLGVSQPAVSRALSQLEARLNVPLFLRDGARLAPTRDALAFNRRLDDLFDALANLEGPSDADAPLETLHLAAPPTLAHRFLTERIATFARLHPTGLIKLEICPSEEVVVGVIEERFDVGVTGSSETRAGLRLLPFRRSATVLAAASDHPLGSSDRIELPSLDAQPYVAVTRRHAWRRWYDAAFEREGVRPRVVAEVGTAVAAVELAQRGLGFTLINPFPLVKAADGMALRPLVETFEHRTSFAVAADRPLANIARAFMRHVRMSIPPMPFSEPMT